MMRTGVAVGLFLALSGGMSPQILNPMADGSAIAAPARPGKGPVGWWRARRGLSKYQSELERHQVVGYRVLARNYRWSRRGALVGGAIPAALTAAISGNPALLTHGAGWVATGLLALTSGALVLSGPSERRELVGRAVGDMLGGKEPDLHTVLLERDQRGALRFEALVGRYAPQHLPRFQEVAARQEAADRALVRGLLPFVGGAASPELPPRERREVLRRAVHAGILGAQPIPVSERARADKKLEHVLFADDGGFVFAPMVTRDLFEGAPGIDLNDLVYKFHRRANEWKILGALAQVPRLRGGLGDRAEIGREELLRTALRGALEPGADPDLRRVLLAKVESGWIRPVYEQAIRRHAPDLMERFLAEASAFNGMVFKPTKFEFEP